MKEIVVLEREEILAGQEKTNETCITDAGGTFTGTGGIDYMAFTFPDCIRVEEFAQEVLGVSYDLFTDAGSGRSGYRKRSYFNNVTIMTDGAQANMGHHVEMTGRACAEYHVRLKSISKWVFSVQGSFTRVDLFVDDYQGYLDMNQIHNAIDEGSVVSTLRRRKKFSEADCNGTVKGIGAYFGSRKGNVFIRTYDKALEQAVDHHWVRAELELKNDAANKVMELLIETDIGVVTKSLLNNYLSFRNATGSDKNRKRWPVADWWEQFLGSLEKLKLVASKDREKSLERTFEWFRRQSVTLALYIDSFGIEGIEDLYEDGKRKQKMMEGCH